MGCGCNKGKVAAATNATVRKVTVYEVYTGTEKQGEFTTLAEARAKAVEVSGRVKVTNKSELV